MFLHQSESFLPVSKTATNSNQVKRLCVAVDIQHLLLWFCRHWRQSHQLLLDADFFVHLKTRCLPSVLRNRWSFWSSSTKFTSSHNENPCAQQIAWPSTRGYTDVYHKIFKKWCSFSLENWWYTDTPRHCAAPPLESPGMLDTGDQTSTEHRPQHRHTSTMGLEPYKPIGSLAPICVLDYIRIRLD